MLMVILIFFFLWLQDFSLQPPAQELIARDLHDVEWKFRHIFRGRDWGFVYFIVLMVGTLF